MIRIQVIAVGVKLPEWIDQGVRHYQKLLNNVAQLAITPLSAPKRQKNFSGEKIKALEGEAMLSKIKADDWVVALDEHGQAWSAHELAGQIQQWPVRSPRVSLLIGGADGLDESCLARANQTWSLSPSTYPHTLVRVMLLEQLYRGLSILSHHPYHRE